MLLVSSFCAAVVGVVYRKRHRETKYLFIYAAASFTETLISIIISTWYPEAREMGVSNMFINVFLIIEIAVLYHFYLQVFRLVRVRIILKTILIMYVTSMISVWLIRNSFHKDAGIFFILQAILILIPGLYYFFEIAKSSSRTNLLSDPVFLVMIGILLYFGCTLPLFLSDSFLDLNKAAERNLYGINCICYALFYLIMTRAFLLKRKGVL